MPEGIRTPDEMSFGDALEELERIVAALEGGQLELEESLTKYERGVALLRALQSKLSDAQQKVTMLIGALESESSEADGLAGASEEPSASVPETSRARVRWRRVDCRWSACSRARSLRYHRRWCAAQGR